MIYPHSQTGCKMAETFTYKYQQEACFDYQAARKENINFGPLSEMRSSHEKNSILATTDFLMWIFDSGL